MTSDNLKSIFATNLKTIMTLRHKNQTDLVKDLGLKQSTVSNWMTGDKYPRMDKIQLLAEYLNVKIIDLVGREAEEAGHKMIHRSTNLQDRYDSMLQELSLRTDDFYLGDIKLDDEDIELTKSMLESYMTMLTNVIKARHAK